LTSRLDLGLDYLRSGYRNLPSEQSLVGTIREVISPRFSLTQLVTHSGGQTSTSFGGTFLSNWVTVGAEYQTLFFPFAAPGQPQFRQVMNVNLHFQFSHGVQLNLATDVSPTGSVRYNAYGTSFAYRQMSSQFGGAAPSGAFFSNVVRGIVQNPEGEPVAGAAIKIGSEIAISNSDGLFFVRLKSASELPLSVVLDEFTAPGAYAIVSTPDHVRPAHEAAAQSYKVVVRRIPAIPAASQP
jgi:hypothetical protein